MPMYNSYLDDNSILDKGNYVLSNTGKEIIFKLRFEVK